MILGTTRLLYKGYRVRNYFIEPTGAVFDFSRFAQHNEDGSINMNQLSDDECLMAPGVIYKKRN
jgi:hypothetical protein